MKDKSYLTFLSVLVGIFPWNFEGGKAEDWEQGMNLELLCSQPVKGESVEWEQGMNLELLRRCPELGDEPGMVEKR